MNKIYTTVWNESRQQWVVTSELASGTGRPKLTPKKNVLALLLGAMLLPSGPVMAVDYVGVTLDGSTGGQTLLSGDTATSTTINSGGSQNVSNGGLASGTTINSGNQFVSGGGTASDTTISGGTQHVYNGGLASGTTINSGVQNVSNGGTATDTTINGGTQQVSSGGLASGTTINGGTQQVSSGGLASGTTINSGTQDVFGTATDTTIDSGYQYVYSGGLATETTINSGAQNVRNGGLASGTTISGGYQYVAGTATDTTINSGGSQHVSNGGTASDTTISGGTQRVYSGGAATYTTINDAGRQIIVDDSTAAYTTISAGQQIVYGSASDTLILGGLQQVQSGATTTNTKIEGGQSWLYTDALADGITTISTGGEMIMEAGSHATDVIINGGTLSVTDLTDDTTSYIPAQVDKLAMDGGNVSFLRDSDGDFAALNITELSGTGNFLFNTFLAERNSNFVTIENGTGQFGIAVSDSGKEIADHTDLTVNLIHDQGGDVDFSMVTANGRSTGAIDGGTYMYTLYSQADKDGLYGNVWYLGAMTEDDNTGGDNGNGDDDNNTGGDNGNGDDDNNTGGDNGNGDDDNNTGGDNGNTGNKPGKLKTTPATNAILSMATAGLNVMRGELDGLRAYRNNTRNTHKDGEGNVWGHYLGKKSAIDTSNGAAYKLHQNGFELGGDITTAFNIGSLVTGGFITLSDNQVNHARGGKSKVDSYGLGAYATWHDNRGFYVDGVIKANRLESKLNAKMTNGGSTSGNWHQYGISSSLEAGFTFKPAEDVYIEPFIRTTGMHINAANVKLSNGMKADTGKARSLTAEAGSRAGTSFTLGSTHFAPYLTAGIEQEFAKSNQSVINGVNRFDNNLNGTSGKYGAGMSAQLADNVTLYGEVNYRQGSHVEDPVQGVAGIRIGF